MRKLPVTKEERTKRLKNNSAQQSWGLEIVLFQKPDGETSWFTGHCKEYSEKSCLYNRKIALDWAPSQPCLTNLKSNIQRIQLFPNNLIASQKKKSGYLETEGDPNKQKDTHVHDQKN